MLRPYAAALCPLQLGARQRLRLLHVGLIERVHPQADAQFPRGILPATARRTQRKRLGPDNRNPLAIRAPRPAGGVGPRDQAAAAPPRARRAGPPRPTPP